jgi:hypothetical protein
MWGRPNFGSSRISVRRCSHGASSLL